MNFFSSLALIGLFAVGDALAGQVFKVLFLQLYSLLSPTDTYLQLVSSSPMY